MGINTRRIGLARRIAFYAIATVFGLLATAEMLNHVLGDVGITSPHIMHSAGHLIVSVTLVIGILSQLWGPGRHQAGLQQVVLMSVTTAGGLALSLYFSAIPIGFFIIGALLAAGTLAALHPRRSALVRLGERNSAKGSAALALVGGAPLAWYALTQAATQRSVGAGTIHGGHFSLMAVAALLVGGLALLSSLRTPGWRIPAYLASASGALLGIISLTFPHEPSVFPIAFAVMVIAWALAGLGYAEWHARGHHLRSRSAGAVPAAEPQP